MANNLPGLNYDSKLNIDDLTFQSDETEKAILDRATIVFGSRALSMPRYGIIDVINPKNVIATETSRPLLVYASTINPDNINITPGTVVTPNGAIVTNPALIEDLSLARTIINDINIVYIENDIIDAPPKRKTRYNVDQYTRKVQSPNIINVALLSDFQNSTLFPSTRISNIVVLAVVTVVPSVTNISGYELSFDYSNSNYSFNRPWYSPVDIEHRSKLGGGIATDTNIHGLTFNDLVSGNLTLYDQLLKVGSIIARDDILNGIPGTPCYDLIDPSRLLQDGPSGSITGSSRFGGPNAYYIELAYYPVKITAFYWQSNLGRDIAWDHIPGTRIVVIPSPESIYDSLLQQFTYFQAAKIEYNRVLAAEPPSQYLSNNLAFNQPDTTKELIFSGGIALSTLTNQFVDFDGSGPVPRNYTLYINSDGTLLKSPQPIQTPYLLDDLGTIINPITASFFSPAKISIGLANANPASSMQIVIQLVGRDDSDNPLTDTLTFSGTTWQSTPPAENPNQYVLTSNVYSVLSSIQVISRVNDGPNSKIQIWAELETGTTISLSKLAKAASLSWDGTGIISGSLKDLRKISSVIPAPINKYRAAAEMVGYGGTPPVIAPAKMVYSEDFANPQLRDSTEGSQSATFATVHIKILDFNKIHVPLSTPPPYVDQIAFPNSKIVYAVGSSPTRAIGEFARMSSNQATRDDLIATLNDSTFSSGYTAVADTSSGADNTVLVTANAAGANGNGLVTFPILTDPLSMSVDTAGLIGGIDAFGECFLPKHVDYIDTSIPSISTYDVSSYRYRYLSIPLPIDNKNTINVLVHGVDVENTIQLRMRYAKSTDPTWLPWEVITNIGTFFTVTKSYLISKIQIQLFGKASGFSVYEV